MRAWFWILSALGSGVSSLALGQSAPAVEPSPAQPESEPEQGVEEEAEDDAEAEGARTAPRSLPAAEPRKAPVIRVETGAPRPPVQSVGVTAPTPPPGAPPPPPSVKVGGGFVLLYMHPFGIAKDSRRMGVPERKPVFEVFRANLLLDSKIDRFGFHLDFRLRDKRMRSFSDGTAWLEEVYASVDLIRAGSAVGPLSLRVGKTYAQFGRFFDYQFHPNLPLRDGIKFDANYGVSLEGVLGAGQRFGAKYYAQYFVLDGGTNTSADNRDTISNPAPLSANAQGLARRRNMFVGRVEPVLSLGTLGSLKVGGSVQNFTADWGPTLDQENVLRFGGDATADVLWFGAWAEYIAQRGRSSRNSPFPPAPAVDGATDPYGRPSAGARPGRSSDRVSYLMAGGRITVKPVMLRYGFSTMRFRDVTYPTADIRGVTLPTVDVTEVVHTPGISIAFTAQLSLWIEYGRYKRHMDAAVLRLPASAGGPRILAAQDWLLDQQMFFTLHGTI